MELFVGKGEALFIQKIIYTKDKTSQELLMLSSVNWSNKQANLKNKESSKKKELIALYSPNAKSMNATTKSSQTYLIILSNQI